MKQRAEIDRVLETWMADGPNAISDRVVDVVAARIGAQRQRRAWPFDGRTNVTQLRLVAVLAAIALIAIVGYNLLPGQPGVGGQTTPLPIASPTATPSSSRVIDLPEGRLPGGRYRFQPLTDVPSLSIVADVPAGWQGGPPWAVIGPNGEEPPGGILLGFLGADGLFNDPCHWDVDGTGDPLQPGDVDVGPEVIDLVEALRANPSYTVPDPPSVVSFGELQGYEMEIRLPSDVDLATCDKDTDGRGRYFVFAGENAGLYAQGNGTDGDRWHLFIVDADGTRVIVAILYFEGTPITDQEAAQAIIESLEFTP
jgi:hypothetical protein